MTLFSLLDNSVSPVWTAFLLGLLFAFHPCPILTNIAAIGYISKEVSDKKRLFVNGIWYMLGRTLAYSALGTVLIALLRKGADILPFQTFFADYGELIVMPFLILIGIAIIFADRLLWFSTSIPENRAGIFAQRGGWGSFGLGALLSLAFCPTSAILFFGLLIPLAATSGGGGYLLPVVFALATALPVVIVAWIMAFSLHSISRFYACMSRFGKWVRIGAGALFIAIGLYLACEHFLFHH
jgi:sulfite exporter TauE/SafE